MKEQALLKTLSLTQELAPTPSERYAFTRLYGEMMLAGENNRDITTALVGALHDGLTRGNWPRVEGAR